MFPNCLENWRILVKIALAFVGDLSPEIGLIRGRVDHPGKLI
jgi:hypothetical protein